MNVPTTEWPPELPPEWEYRRLKFAARRPIKSGVGAPSDHDDPAWPRYIRITDIAGPRELRQDTFRSLPPEQAATAPVTRGDILLAAVGATYGKSLLFDGDAGTACYAGYLVRFSPLSNADSRFFSYWTQSRDYWYQVDREVIQATIQNFSASRYRELIAPYPPAEVQRAIASFLDRETARIDTLIEKKRRLLDLLEEKRTAVITRAVTRGLDPDVPMKDSGVEWIGEIPEHWEVTKLGLLFSVQLGKMLDSSRITGDHLRPYLRVADVQWGAINTADLPQMDFGPTDRVRYRLEPGDLLVNEGGSYVGRSAIWRGELDDCYYQKALHRVRARSAENSTRFLFYIMWWATHQGVFVAGGNQTTIDHLTAEQLRGYRFAFPPPVEQERIADYLGKATQHIDRTRERVSRAIRLLQEYRTALISAAVTGKIDVTEPALAPA